MLPTLHRRFYNIADGRIAFVLAKEGFAEPFYFVPGEDAAGPEFFIQPEFKS